MLWALLAILAAFLYAIISILDKYVLVTWIRKPMASAVINGTVGLLAALVIFLVVGFEPLSAQNIILALFAGVLGMVGSLFYFKAVKAGEISRIVPLFYLSPVFILFLAAIFLGEVLGFVQYLGVFLIVVGAMLISSRNFKFDFGKAFWFVIIGCLIFSVCSVLVKYLLDFADFWTVFSYVRIGMIFLLIPMACLSVGELKSAVKKHGAKVLGVMSLSEILTVAAVLIGTIAVSIGSVTLVNALSSIEPFFVLFIALILSVHHPKILKEELGKAVVLVKLAAVILIFAGAILIM